MLLEKEQKLEEGITGRHVKAFLDLLILAILNGKPMYGYKIIAAVHKEFGVLLSPGSLYPLLHALEEKGMVESQVQEGRIIYSMTSNGKKIFQNTFTEYKATIRQMDNFINSNTRSPSQAL
jgi:PadR family transcriptional regulator PadR